MCHSRISGVRSTSHVGATNVVFLPPGFLTRNAKATPRERRGDVERTRSACWDRGCRRRPRRGLTTIRRIPPSCNYTGRALSGVLIRRRPDPRRPARGTFAVQSVASKSSRARRRTQLTETGARSSRQTNYNNQIGSQTGKENQTSLIHNRHD